MFFDPMYFLWVGPAILLGLWAQYRIRSTYHAASQMPTKLSGAAAARYVLRSAGLDDVGIEQVPGQLSDHYDPREKVLRLSPDVYAGNSLAAVGIAAHEAGHAIQDAQRYAPLVVRNFVVPMASIGTNIGVLLLFVGMFFSMRSPLGNLLIWSGIGLFSSVVFFQLVNLPVEFDASARAKSELVRLGIIDTEELRQVNKVLNAAALTYVAATLQSILTLMYYLSIANRRRE